ncbi:MAG: hypothetical protein ACT4TC_17885 [Myxococcaceae bacterium]
MRSERTIIFLISAVQYVNLLDFMMVRPLGPDFAQRCTSARRRWAAWFSITPTELISLLIAAVERRVLRWGAVGGTPPSSPHELTSGCGLG